MGQALELIVTLFTPAEAEVIVVALPEETPAEGLELSGQAVGPRSAFAETIEVAYRLRPLPRTTDALRARFLIPEPLAWSPDRPFLYSVTAQVGPSEEGQQHRATLGLKDLRLHPRKGLRLNGQALELVGVLGRGFTEEDLRLLREKSVNLLVAPLAERNLPLWPLASRLGFFVLGQVDPEDDALLWQASETLNREPSALGWLLPQALAAQPQRWHNAVSLLHNQRPDLYLGIQVESLPLGALPGHVAFAMAGPELLAALATEGLPGLALLPRGQSARPAEGTPARLGTVRRMADLD